MPKTKQEIVKKHTSSIHTASKLSLTQRKLMNALLLQAYDYLPVQKTHKVDIKTLCAMIGYDSKNTRPLKDALVALAHTAVEWDILTPENKNRWKVSSLLASAEIEDGICEYSYSPVLAKELYQPERFALINMAVQRKFNSSYSLALYENCLRYKAIKTTGFWDIDDFRRLLGVDGIKTYSTFGRLNDLLIKPAVKEINKYSDITIKPYVDKKGRSVCAIRFSVKENAQMPLLGVSDDDEVTQSRAYNELIKRGMSKVFSKDAVLRYGEDYIFEQLGIADDFASRTKIKGSKQGIIRKAISEGFTKPESLAKEERRKTAEQDKIKADRITRKLDELKAKRRKIEKDFRVMFVEMIQSVFEVSSNDEQSEIINDYLTKYPSTSVTGPDFQTHRWASLLNWSSIQEYWRDVRSLPCPSFEEFSLQRGIKELDAEIKKLTSL